MKSRIKLPEVTIPTIPVPDEETIIVYLKVTSFLFIAFSILIIITGSFTEIINTPVEPQLLEMESTTFVIKAINEDNNHFAHVDGSSVVVIVDYNMYVTKDIEPWWNNKWGNNI